MSKILDLYNAGQKELGVDKISKAAYENAKTPYTTNDFQKADDKVLNAAKLKIGRNGDVNERTYSSVIASLKNK
jgi:hypothetical protein